ncbi:MAG: HAMP domain-containing protein [Bacteroidia bacterium]|nr:HAMP domain-containing protein [Bacteroidia bacterium]
MRIKTKLNLSVGLLFSLIVIMVFIGGRYITALKMDTENILVANYHSLEYSRMMLSELENKSEDWEKKFEINLKKQSNNITEVGEKELTLELKEAYETFNNNRQQVEKLSQIRKCIYGIMELNIQAIQRKSEIAKATADKAITWISITGTICFVIAFILLVNLPAHIANPLKELSESIKQIAANKYSERVHFESHNEFGELALSFNTMAQKLEEYNSSNLAKLMMEKKRIETLINNMHDPVIGLDENYKILFANTEAIHISGIRKEVFIGKNILDIAKHNDLIRNLIHNIEKPEMLLSGKPQQIKIYANGKEGYFENNLLPIAITPTGEEGKQVIGHVILLRDVTEYKELDFAKTNFIATVSHEFKTPISSIKMSLQLLENEQIGKLNIEQTNLVESIKEDAERLLNITKELLNITQVESGNIQLSILPIDLKETIQYAVNANRTQLEQKKITLQKSGIDTMPKVLADNEKTAWVLTNLISNAIRYSYDNSVIELRAEMEKDHLKIAIKDFGQGIAPQYKDKIFNRYFRVPGTQKEGTGLGLAISKEFIEAQGGSISLSSDYGEGSEFTVTFNLA